MKRNLSLLIVTFLLVLVSAPADAQLFGGNSANKRSKIANFKGQKRKFDKYKRYVSVGASVNSLNYFGDLAPLNRFASTDISFTRPGIGLHGSQRFGPRFTVRGDFTWGVLRGDDFSSADPFDNNARYRYVRNLHFRNFVKELSGGVMFDLWENKGNYVTRKNWTPYAFLSVGVFHHNPKALAPDFDLSGNPLPEAGTWVALRPLGTEGQFSNLPEDHPNFGARPYSLLQFVIPFGLGVRYKLNNAFDISFEMGYRFTFTDYLDDVSKHYVDLGHLNSPLAKAMSDRTGEAVHAISRNPRNFDVINAITNPYSYVGVDGRIYNTRAGYGHDHPDNVRGNRTDNDVYIITSIKLSYIIGASLVGRAKFR